LVVEPVETTITLAFSHYGRFDKLNDQLSTTNTTRSACSGGIVDGRFDKLNDQLSTTNTTRSD